MWWTALLGCDDTDALVRAWHRSFSIESAALATDTEGECDPALEPADPGADYGFLAVSAGVPDIASLYLCDGPRDVDCPAQPVGNIWIRDWTERRLAGETGVSSLFGDLCTLVWYGIDATRDDGGALHLELRQATRQTSVAEQEECDDALEDLIRSSCDSVLVLDGEQQ